MKHRVPIALVTACVATLLTAGAAAQIFRSAVNLVVLQATVTDADGRSVSGLSRDEFSVYEDDAERRIEQFSAARLPISLGILVDISGSMEGRRFKDAQQALGKLLERLHEEDQIFLAVFNSSLEVLVPWTSDRGSLLQSLSGVLPRGGTYLYSAISNALPILNRGLNRKKALVVISDGDDNEKMVGLNRSLLERAVQQARQSEALIYVIGIGTPKPPIAQWVALDAETRRRFFFDPPVDVELLRQLSNPTGGYTQVASAADLPSTLISVADDLATQYMIGFESGPVDSRFHTLKVKVRNAQYRVRAKTGYANPSDETQRP